MNVTFISFSDVKPLWEILWEKNEFKPMSSMINATDTDLYIYELFEPYFFGIYDGETLIGVNSGHKTSNTRFRSRGLYVIPEYRRTGVASLLLQATIEKAKNLDCDIVWSLPREESLAVYEANGFFPVGDYVDLDYAKNILVEANV